jgi:hypothetical protein
MLYPVVGLPSSFLSFALLHRRYHTVQDQARVRCKLPNVIAQMRLCCLNVIFISPVFSLATARRKSPLLLLDFEFHLGRWATIPEGETSMCVARQTSPVANDAGLDLIRVHYKYTFLSLVSAFVSWFLCTFSFSEPHRTDRLPSISLHFSDPHPVHRTTLR